MKVSFVIIFRIKFEEKKSQGRKAYPSRAFNQNASLLIPCTSYMYGYHLQAATASKTRAESSSSAHLPSLLNLTTIWSLIHKQCGQWPLLLSLLLLLRFLVPGDLLRRSFATSILSGSMLPCQIILSLAEFWSKVSGLVLLSSISRNPHICY